MEALRRLAEIETPQIADAVLRIDAELRLGPADLLPMREGMRVAGRVLPARHAGSVDVFLEALESSAPGDVMVIDDEGSREQACIGDLTVLEMQAAGLGGVVVWGSHRDHRELLETGFPVFSLGRRANGPPAALPAKHNALGHAHFGECIARPSDAIFGDDNGVILVALDLLDRLAPIAVEIRDGERSQVERIARGESLRAQLNFGAYLERRATDPEWTFRRHLRERGGEIEQ